MKVAVIGSKGQLGSDLISALGDNTIGFDHIQVQVESLNSARKALANAKPDIIINTAAYHNVGQCEQDPDDTFLINTIGARNIAVIGEELDAKVVYISTDYVFSGTKGSPYNEFDDPNPINTYGISKVKGEEYTRYLNKRHFIVRLSGLVGKHGSKSKGGNFIDKILAAGREKPVLTVVADQFFSPTFTKDAALKIIELIKTNLYGTYHITNSNWCSWYQFAKKAIDLAGYDTKVEPILASSFSGGVKRPAFSVLDNYNLRLQGFNLLRDWKDALKEHIEEIISR